MSQNRNGILGTNCTEKKEEIACFDVSNKLRINKNVNLSPLEYTLKGYDHISDLLLANY